MNLAEWKTARIDQGLNDPRTLPQAGRPEKDRGNTDEKERRYCWKNDKENIIWPMIWKENTFHRQIKRMQGAPNDKMKGRTVPKARYEHRYP